MANQQSWHEDERKVTFIICARGGDGSPEAGATCDAGTTTTPQDAPTPPDTPPFDLTLNMVGDVNAFLSEIISDPQGDEDEGEPTGRLSAEMEVMIADASQRRRGMAEEALLLLIHFLLDRVPAVRELVAKVSDGNEASLRLFTHRLGFHTRRRLDVFSQTELAMDAADARRRAEDAWRESGAREMEAPV
jgi:RimJ/RimL family protein N-acetyltransferase